MIKSFTILLLFVFGTLPLAFSVEHPTKRDIVDHGYFHFPQHEATVMHNSSELRLSVWNNNTLLYVQAVLWNDYSKEIRINRYGRQLGDSSTLYIDTDASVSLTPRVDRCYSLDPWLSMNGLYYSILLGECSRTFLKDNSKGTGSICYVNLKEHKKVRIDNYVIPLQELNKSCGEKIRLVYCVASAVPEFRTSSVGRIPIPMEECRVPVSQKKFHPYRLKKGKELTISNIASAWSEETHAFSISRPTKDTNEFRFIDDSISIEPLFGVSVSHNSPAQLKKELKDKAFLQMLGGYLGIKPEKAAKLKFTYDTEDECFELQQNGTHPAVFNSIGEAIDRYVQERYDGHTKKYMLASFEEISNVTDVNDKDLLLLLKEYPYLPPSWLNKTECRRFYTDPNGTERCISYFLVDGEIAWTYELIIKSDGSSFCSERKRDAKEYDPKYRMIIKDTEKQVGRKMKKKGIRGIGSIHYFWRFKKKKLKKKGIDWRSPSELSPGTFYD